jgi:SAM-dependent methyltransferase
LERREYDKLNAVEDEMWWFRGNHANLLTAFRTRAERLPAGPVLDAGCGTGGLLRSLVAAAPDAALVGLDFAMPAAAVAATKSGHPVAVGSVNALPFDDEAFAAVFSMDVLCHRGVDQATALAEAHRCLAPGGVLVINLPAYRWMLSTHDERVHNVRRYTRAEVVAMLKEGGFPSISASYWNTFLFPLMVLKRKILGGEDSDVHPFPAAVELLFRCVLGFERLLMRLGVRLPFGGSIFAVAVKSQVATPKTPMHER